MQRSIARREGSPFTGLGPVFMKEFSDHLSSARMMVLMLFVIAFGALTVAPSLTELRNVTESDPFLFLRIFTSASSRVPFSFTAALGFTIPLLAIGLGFDSVNAWRLLQGFDDVREQSLFDLVAVRTATSVADRVADEEIADNALILLIDKEGVAEDAAPLDGSIAREDFGVHVPEDHLRRGGVVPGKRAAPHGDLIFQQRSKVGGREMSEIENFHKKEGLRC